MGCCWALGTEPVILTSWESPSSLRTADNGVVLARTAVLWADYNPVFHFGDAGRRPGDALRFLAFDPGANGAFQYHLAAVGFDRDPIGVQLGISLECFHDLALEFGGLRLGLDLDYVGHALDALHLSHAVFSGGFLILPLHRAFHGHPAVLDAELD